jgi:UDP-2,3-diacylglucosamine pyrophosphatase LpxH
MITFTGDLSFSGRTEEFSLASVFLEQVVSALRDETGIDPFIVVVPGNHDCHFRQDSAVRDLVLRKVREQRGECDSDEMLKQCLGVQNSFFEWASENSLIPELDLPKRFCWLRECRLRTGQNVVFLCLNTAWMSTLHEQQGQLFFPTDKIPSISSADVVIAMLHHPYNWIEAANARLLRRTLEESCDIILTGHEHESEIFKKSTQAGATTEYVEGDVFQTEMDPARSGFNLILFDSTLGRFQLRPYTWKDSRYNLALSDDPEWASFTRNNKRKNRPYELSSDMFTFLRDPGAQLTHASKTLALEDIFITPNLRRFGRLSSTEGLQKEIVESEFVMNQVFADRYAYFSGDGPCGKSSLAKMLYLQGLRRGFVPVYLTGEQLTHVDPERLQKIILNQYSKQYSHPIQELSRNCRRTRKS